MSETAFRSNNEASLNTDQISDAVDKIDMSLDDIIKLNRREQRIARMSGMAQNWHRGPWLQKGIPRKGPQQTKSFNRIGIRGRRLQPPSRRRPQGVLTGLALRKAQPLNKGVSPLNRQAFHMMRARQMLQGRLNTYRQPSGLWMPLSASSSRSGLPANSFRPLMTLPVLQSQKDARQATFLFRRGLTVQTPLHPGSGQSLVSQRTRRWRMTTTNNGILTVSIDNPAARLFAEHLLWGVTWRKKMEGQELGVGTFDRRITAAINYSIQRYVCPSIVPQQIIFFHTFLSSASCYITPITCMSSLTTSINLLLGLPLFLLPDSSIFNILFPIYPASLFCTCPNQLNLASLTLSPNRPT
ncbi:UIF factor, partial [Polypterus senegalus]|nr:UIF factor [Polypterus senegalus]